MQHVCQLVCNVSTLSIKQCTVISTNHFLLTGSPADQAQLEVGDEIVEVNGHNLEGYSHAEVIELIHQVHISNIIMHWLK